jgi:cystathionine beta-lyase/cystathionine gamma-synthase
MSPQIPHHNLGFGTRAVHAGQVPDEGSNAVIPTISMSTTFKQFSPGVHKVLRTSLGNILIRKLIVTSI